ncbi:hypothetical protein ACSBR1_004315 [Camellia fascicularis]
MEAFAAKLFATISVVKAAYAELQMAQFPYNCEAIQSADEVVVYELKSLSELKQSFLKKQLGSSPSQVTMLLAEIQEQQSLMKMFDITMNKMRSELDTKESASNPFFDEFLQAPGFSLGCGFYMGNFSDFSEFLWIGEKNFSGFEKNFWVELSPEKFSTQRNFKNAAASLGNSGIQLFAYGLKHRPTPTSTPRATMAASF